MIKEKYRMCTKCNTIHIIHRNFKDRCPTCFRCGGTLFSNADIKNDLQNGHYPIYCDWNLQHKVDEAAEKVSEFIISRHSVEIDKEILNDLKQFLVFAANSSRRDFAFSREAYEKFSSPLQRVK